MFVLLLLREHKERDRGAPITLQLGSLRCLKSGRRKQSLHSSEMNALSSTAKLTDLSVHLDHAAANIVKALTEVVHREWRGAKQAAKLPWGNATPPVTLPNKHPHTEPDWRKLRWRGDRERQEWETRGQSQESPSTFQPYRILQTSAPIPQCEEWSPDTPAFPHLCLFLYLLPLPLSAQFLLPAELHLISLSRPLFSPLISSSDQPSGISSPPLLPWSSVIPTPSSLPSSVSLSPSPRFPVGSPEGWASSAPSLLSP